MHLNRWIVVPVVIQLVTLSLACKSAITAQGCSNEKNPYDLVSRVPVSHLRTLDGQIVWWSRKYPWISQGMFDNAGNFFGVTKDGAVIRVDFAPHSQPRVVLTSECRGTHCLSLGEWRGTVSAFIQEANFLLVHRLGQAEEAETLPLPSGFEVHKLMQISDTSFVMASQDDLPKVRWSEVVNRPTRFIRANIAARSRSTTAISPAGVHGPVLGFVRDNSDPNGAWGILTPGVCVGKDEQCKTKFGGVILSIFFAESTEVVTSIVLDSAAVAIVDGRIIGMQHERICSWSIEGGEVFCEPNSDLPQRLVVTQTPAPGIVLGAENFVSSYRGVVGALRQSRSETFPSCAKVMDVNSFSASRIFIGFRPRTLVSTH